MKNRLRAALVGDDERHLVGFSELLLLRELLLLLLPKLRLAPVLFEHFLDPLHNLRVADDEAHLATGIEAEAASRPYEFGDTLNLDIPGTLTRAMRRGGVRVPLDLEYDDLLVHQSEYRSSCATVLLLDISHSMILYGEDRFTPAKKVALALSHLLDETDAYKRLTIEILRRRRDLLFRGLGVPVPQEDPLRAWYYVELDFMVWATREYGKDFVDYMVKYYEPVDLLFRVAEESSVVLLDGGGFGGPPWSIRVSLANLDDDDYAKIGGRSPILENTQEQARALEAALGPGYRAYIAMRAWHPFTQEAVDALLADGAERVVHLPMYPHRSRATRPATCWPIPAWPATPDWIARWRLSVPPEPIALSHAAWPACVIGLGEYGD